MTGSSGASSTPRRRSSYSDASAFSMMEAMEGKLDKHLLQAFRPVAFGQY
jgi:hypothetical protein